MVTTKQRDVTYIESIQVDDITVRVFVNNQPRTKEEIHRSLERLIKSRYKHKI